MFGFGGGQQRRGEFFVEGKQEFHALAVALKFFRTVAEIHGAIQFRVGFSFQEIGMAGTVAKGPPVRQVHEKTRQPVYDETRWTEWNEKGSVNSIVLFIFPVDSSSANASDWCVGSCAAVS